MSRLPYRTAGLAALFAIASVLHGQTPTPTPTPSTPTPTPSATPPPTPTLPPTTVPAAQTWTTENSTSVTGVRIRRTDDGSIWFLTPSDDRIVRLQGTTMTQWQIRPTANIGANPVDFQIDGDQIWFIENGETLIDASDSAIGRLDTTTGELREWVLPISRPAGFYRAPDGRIWVPQSAGVMEVLDINTLAVTDYRANPTVTFASCLAVGPDGALWIADFGNNRIVRHSLVDDSETAWTIFDPTGGVRLNPADIAFDDQGFLWIAELSATRVDRFDPATGTLRAYPGISTPLHLDVFGGRIYVTQETGGNGSVAVLDPAVAPFSEIVLPPETLDVRTLARPAATIRDTVITPTTFTSTNATIAVADLPVTSSTPGILVTGFNSTNAYGILVDGGAVYVGSDGKLVRMVLQTVGGPTDQSVPVALQFGGPTNDSVRVDLTLFNRGTASITGDALYLFSPGAKVQAIPFDVGPGETVEIEDAFAGAPSEPTLLIGPVRLLVAAGQASDLSATIRSARVLDGGGSFGIAARAQPLAETLAAGETWTLFTGHRPTDISAFGFYSPGGAQATATLVASDGTVRGTGAISIESNIAEEFNPAASFFGVAPQAGDVIRIQVSSGNLQPYVDVQDALTRDVALSLPIAPTASSVIPNAGSTSGGGRTWASGLFLSNPDATRTAHVTATFHPLNGETPPASMIVTLPPGGSVAFGDVVSDLFHASPGQGAITLQSDVPVAAAARFAAQNGPDQGQFASFAAAIDGASAIGTGGALAFGLPATPLRRTTLFLYNGGAAGTATITGFDANGAPAGQLAVPIGAQIATRVDRILEALGSAATLGHIRVDASTGMFLYAQTVEVDAATGDTEAQSVR